MTKEILKLCAGMLSHYGSMMGKKVCQDFDPTATGVDYPTKLLGKEACDEIMKLYEVYNSDGEDYDSDSWKFMDDGMVCGSAMSEVLKKIDVPSKIRMTKELPTEVGFYYWCGEDKQDIEIVEVESSKLHNGGALYVDCCEAGLVDADRLGGYWAKVEKGQFEFEG